MAETTTIALTGGTGFVGRHLLPKLLERGRRVRVLVRDPARLQLDPQVDPQYVKHVEPITGDLFDNAALAALVEGVNVVIHLVGIIEERRGGQTFERVHVEGPRRLLAAAKSAGVQRWVHMSALGTREDAVSTYHRTKWSGEQAVRDSGVPHVILRPSLIHGPNGEFMQMIKGFLTQRMNPPLFGPTLKPPYFTYFIPYFGAGLLGRGGAGRLQPVWVEDVAACFASAVDTDAAIGQTYGLGGKDVMTWPELYRTCQRHIPGAAAVAKQPIGVPAWYAKLIAPLPGVPFNRDQVIMSQEDSVCDNAAIQRDLGVEPAPFESTLASYAGHM